MVLVELLELAILDGSTNFLNVGFHPQVKEFIYEDVNTILSFEDDIPTLGNVDEGLPGIQDNFGVHELMVYKVNTLI